MLKASCGSATIADGQVEVLQTPKKENVMSQQMPLPSTSLNPNALQILCEDRQLDPELLAKLGISGNFKRGCEWVQIPYTMRGETVNHKHRTISGEKLMHQDADAKKCFWNFDCLLDPSLSELPLIITEGEFDAITAIQCGYVRTMSVPDGAPAQAIGMEETVKYSYLDDALPLLKDCREIIIASDGDPAGANLLHDLALRLGKTRCKYLQYPKGCKDLNEVLVKYGSRGITETINRAKWLAVDGVYKMSDLPPPPETLALKSGFPGMDGHYKIRFGDMVVLTGIPGHGKSTFLNDLCCRCVDNLKLNVAFASFEQHPAVDHKRNLVKWYLNRPGALMIGEAEAERWIDDHFCFLVPSEDDDVTLEWVLEKCSAAVLRHQAKILVIDPWNEMDHIRPMDMSLTEYTGYAIKQFRKFARKHQVHLIIAAHPSKPMKGPDDKMKIPSLYDISDSAHWYNKADVGIIVFRDGSRTKIKIAKSRYHDIIGKPGTREYIFYEASGRYDLAET